MSENLPINTKPEDMMRYFAAYPAITGIVPVFPNTLYEWARQVDLLRADVKAVEDRAYQRGLRDAATDVDCQCAVRNAVLTTLREQGERAAERLCQHGDVCCALTSESILRLIPKAKNQPT